VKWASGLLRCYSYVTSICDPTRGWRYGSSIGFFFGHDRGRREVVHACLWAPRRNEIVKGADVLLILCQFIEWSHHRVSLQASIDKDSLKVIGIAIFWTQDEVEECHTLHSECSMSKSNSRALMYIDVSSSSLKLCIPSSFMVLSELLLGGNQLIKLWTQSYHSSFCRFPGLRFHNFSQYLPTFESVSSCQCILQTSDSPSISSQIRGGLTVLKVVNEQRAGIWLSGVITPH